MVALEPKAIFWVPINPARRRVELRFDARYGKPEREPIMGADKQETAIDVPDAYKAFSAKMSPLAIVAEELRAPRYIVWAVRVPPEMLVLEDKRLPDG